MTRGANRKTRGPGRRLLEIGKDLLIAALVLVNLTLAIMCLPSKTLTQTKWLAGALRPFAGLFGLNEAELTYTAPATGSTIVGAAQPLIITLSTEAGRQSAQYDFAALDEYLIQDLWMQDARIDAFGVGERLITAKSEPVFGCVYKLVAVEDKDGNIVPKIKISENVGKITTPHFKKLYRFYGRDTGKAIADYLTVYDETVDDSQNLEIFDPDATWKRKEVYHFEARELLVPIYQKGKLVYKRPGIEEIKKYCAEQVDTLWDEVKRFDNPHNYYVDLSQKLYDIKTELLNEKNERYEKN